VVASPFGPKPSARPSRFARSAASRLLPQASTSLHSASLSRFTITIRESAKPRSAAAQKQHFIMLSMDRIDIPALAKGTRVVKCASNTADTIRDGALGRVVEALGPAAEDCPQPGQWGYMVMWDSLPGASVYVPGSRIRAVAATETAAPAT
jgi:hypothetical protein